MAAIEPAAPARSQSRLSPVLFWALLAALLFRVVTAVMERAESGGLVRWGSPEASAARAASAGKPILYDFTAAWCGPCKLLERDFEEAEIAERVNAAFVPVRVVDRQREDGKNLPDVAALQTRYEVSGFPTLVIAAPDGRLIGKHEGYRGREALREFLEAPAPAAP